MTLVDSAMKDADLLLYLVEAEEPFNDEFIKELQAVKNPVVVVMNKVDLNQQEQIAERLSEWKERLPDAELLPTSALHKFNTRELLELVKNHLPEHPPYYDKEDLTDRPVRFFVAEMIRGAILKHFKKEVPYAVEVLVTNYKEETKLDRIDATIFVERETQKMIIIGQGGRAIKRVGTDARKSIENFIQKKIFLDLTVKVRKDWRSNENDLKEFGYQ